MKKPKITEGEWELRHDNPLTISVRTTARPASNSIAGIWREEDAKAISAVPEMLDALISAYEQLERLEDWGEDLSPSRIEKIHKALKKAGVQI